MKRHYILITFFALSIAAFGQPMNTEIDAGTSPKLIGKINKDGLSNGSYASWFNKNYSDYNPDEKSIAKIGSALNAYTIELYMGTWCGDSKRQVPRFYKVLDALDFPLERLTAIALDNKGDAYKQSPGGEHEGKNIHRVPTFIFYKDGKEINRIVESPKQTLEEDILNILNNTYTPNYSGVHFMAKQLESYGAAGVDKRAKKIKKQLMDKVERVYDLNTYARVLMRTGKKEEAITVSRINLLLYPDSAYAHGSLASKLNEVGQSEEAIVLLEKAIVMDPDDNRYQDLLDTIQASGK